jgi:hypothetical protein
VINLETSNELIWDEVSILRGNVINLETSNTLIWDLPIVANTSTLTGVIKGDLLYASQDNQITTLALSSTGGHVLTADTATGLPAWKAPTGGGGGTTLQNITENGGDTGISNTNPEYTLQVGSNVVIDDTGSDVISVNGNIYSTHQIVALNAVKSPEIYCTKLFIGNSEVAAERPPRKIRLN